MSLGPQGYDPRTAHPMYRGSPLPSPQLQPYNPQAIADTTRGARAAPPAHSQHAGPSTATTSSAADTDRDYVDDDYEDKRRRNTAASARFRIKKKMRGLELERSVSDLTGRAEELEREAADLRRENGWLKEIVMLKGGHLSGIDLSGGMAQQRSQEKRREEAQEESESESEKEHSGKDRKGKGKASSKKK
ncbi:Cytochrome C oxidase assembly protein COX19 [Mycena indigotica]|uniref:Cytochrome C oxidase assembly protein COX19 n=1 Tax=Mycena indigotica TaxID=2126181 RepID=A0A8H6W5J4_9AGAR|nr:Cytochrome C oxidase assembly protein COX19 [Mycena indigotica]KAF7306599.1 Cytochrome C oxidase assembly protein COX19 [Mycena indigotica]